MLIAVDLKISKNESADQSVAISNLSIKSGEQIAKDTYAKIKLRKEIELLKQTQLPLWPDEQRAIPNGILRSALFSAIQSNAKRYIDGEKIASLSGIEIRYTGQSLDQGDLGVWEAVLHILKHQNLGVKCYTSTYYILKLLGLTDTGSNRTILYKRLTRLVATALELEQGKYRYIGSLITEAERDISTGKIFIILNPKIISLFQSDQYTHIHFELCHALKKPLAKWLYRFYATHAKPFPLKIETIHRLCGSYAKTLTDFKKHTLKNALEEVSKVSAAYGKKFEYEIKGDLLHIMKSGNSSQLKYITKKTVDKLPSQRTY